MSGETAERLWQELQLRMRRSAQMGVKMKRNSGKKRRTRKTMIWKSAFREIRQSFGRFAAILAIVALGVGFFAGLKVAKPAMLETAGEYLAALDFYDYRILSTLGFEQQEADALREKEGVESAEGAVSFDILYQDESGREAAAKVHSITGEVNRLKPVAGRMPQSADECVVDGNLFPASSIGQKLTLSENNAQEDLEHFAYREYTIVGVVQSPAYIQFERGNTSLGTGKISGFVYLPYEGFDTDCYTEIFVKFSEDYPLYSDAYDAFLDEKESVWEGYAKEAASARYERIVSEAEAELADARAEYEEEKADGRAELADAWTELVDAREELEDGKQQIADAKKELSDGRKTIAGKEQELAEAEQTIAEKEQELADGEQEIADGIKAWNDGKYKLDQAKGQLQSAIDQVSEQKTLLEAREQELLDGEAALEEAETALKQQEQVLAASEGELALQEQALKEAYGEGNIPEEIMAQLETGRQQLAAGKEQVAAGLAQTAEKRTELAAGRTALEEGKAAIAASEQQLAEGREQTKGGDKGLADAWKQIEEGQQELADGRKALEDAKTQLEDGRTQLADARRKITDGERTLAEKETELADGQAEYEDGLKEYQDGVSEFEEKTADAERELADAAKEIADIEKPESYVLGRDTNVGYVCFENDSSIVAGIANIFPVFFFLVAALVCITTMNRMVEEQRTQIGVLKALGYGKGIIMSKYMVYSGTAAVIGCVLGFIGGTILFPNVIWAAYGIMYRMDSLVYVFDWRLAAISLAVSLLCSVGTTWLSCRMELSQVAAELMRPKSPRAGKRIFLEYIPFVWKKMGFLKKVSARNIFRYKKRLIMMVLGISGCTALLVTGFGVEDSIADVAEQQFEEIQIYDIGVTFSREISAEDKSLIESAAGVDQGGYALACETTFDLVTETGQKGLNLLVFDKMTDMTPYLGLHTEKGKELAFSSDGEAVITNKLAETYGLQVGDTITLQNEDMETITAKISGINQNFIYNYAYINNETYREQTGETVEYRSAYLNLPEGADAHLVSAELMKGDHVASVSVNQDTLERFSGMMKSLDLIVAVIILCAAGLAFIVLYNLTNINITERIREIATIKVLGFRKKETAAYVFRENMVLAAFGIVVGLFLGHFLHLFVMNEINIDMIAFDIRVRPVSYFYSVLLTFVFAWGINMIMGGKLERISMTESLKSVD